MAKKSEVKVPIEKQIATIKEAIANIPTIAPLTQDFTSISEVNILRDKINEIIKVI